MLGFIVGCWFGVGIMAALASNSYDKGYNDALNGVGEHDK